MKALLLVDIQQGLEPCDYYGNQRNNPDAETKAGTILTFFREKGWPVFHVKHLSTDPNSPLFPAKGRDDFKPQVKPIAGEPVFQKNVNSAFIGTELHETLDREEIRDLVIVGLTTDHCISTTVRMAANLGFNTELVADATATFNKVGVKGEVYDAETMHLTALASLKDEFARIVNTDELITELS